MLVTFLEHLLRIHIPGRFIFLSSDRSTGELLQEYRGHTNKVSLQTTKSGYSTFKCSIYVALSTNNVSMQVDILSLVYLHLCNTIY